MASKLTTGIEGLNAILHGGYLKNASTIIKGGPGSGKTIFSLFFAHAHFSKGSKVVYITCDETIKNLTKNMDSYRMDASSAIDNALFTILDSRPAAKNKFLGVFDKQRDLASMLDDVKEQLDKENPILIIDSLHNLIFPVENEPGKDQITIPEKEVYRLFSWSRANNVTLVITSSLDMNKSKIGMLAEYACDSVILLEQNIEKQLMTRYLTVKKMRGSGHGTNQYPFCLTDKGISLFPVTESRMLHHIVTKKISTGIVHLDKMLGGGLYESSFTITNGTTGSAKTLLAATVADAVASSGKKVLFLSFEESEGEILRNVQSIGINLKKHVDSGLLDIVTRRPTEFGLEYHLLNMIDMVKEKQPFLFIIDPLSSLLDLGSESAVKDVVIRFSTAIKDQGTTIVANDLIHHGAFSERSLTLSSILDTIIMLRRVENNGEFARTISVLKSRGKPTSSQIKEFKVTSNGIEIEAPYIGQGGMTFGSAKGERRAQDSQKKKMVAAELDAVKEALGEYESVKKGKTQLDELQVLMIRQNLLAKQRQLEQQLLDIKEIEDLNQRSRE